MKFNLAYLGPEALFHLRRDFLLVTKFGLEDLGHDVALSGGQLDSTRFNLIVGAYFRPPDTLARIAKSGLDFAHINTEIIANDQVNFRPDRVDFRGSYLPAMQAGRFVWDVVMDNLAEHGKHRTRAYFMRWGWHPKLEDVDRDKEKSLDYYLFGMLSPRRQQVLQELSRHGYTGIADATCPYFLRNDRIARAKVQLNVIQDDQYTHVNSFRICYLANNRCAILSEAENDPAGYLSVAHVVHRKEEIPGAMAELLEGDRWKAVGEAAYEKFRAIPMARCMEQLLDESFAAPLAQAAGGPA